MQTIPIYLCIFFGSFFFSILLVNLYYWIFDKKKEDMRISIDDEIKAKDILYYSMKERLYQKRICIKTNQSMQIKKVKNQPEPPQFPNVPSKDRAKHR